jgi:hypothetical protein
MSVPRRAGVRRRHARAVHRRFQRLAHQRGQPPVQGMLVDIAVQLAIRAQQHLVDHVVGRELAGGEVADRLEIGNLVADEVGQLLEVAGDEREEHLSVRSSSRRRGTTG